MKAILCTRFAVEAELQPGETLFVTGAAGRLALQVPPPSLGDGTGE